MERRRRRARPEAPAGAAAGTRHPGAAIAEILRQRLFGVEGELALAGLRQVDAVVGAQPHRLAVDVRAGGDEGAVLVDETVPDVDEFAAGVLGRRLVDVVEGQHVGGHLRRLERRHADPEERHLASRDRLAKRVGARAHIPWSSSPSAAVSRSSSTRICWRSLAPSMTTTAAGFSASISVVDLSPAS